MNILTVNNLNLTVGNEIKIKNGCFDVSSGDVILLTGPNGCGKSTIIKIIMGAIFSENSNINYSASKIVYCTADKEIELSTETSREYFRKNVGYISQEDEFESESVLDCFFNSLNYSDIHNKMEYVLNFIKTFSVADFFNISATGRLTGKARRIAKKYDMNYTDISEEDEKAFRLLAMSNKKMSGGQKKLTNIVTNLIRYEYSNLLIFDEPLNNLDYNNVRAFSNMLSRIHQQKPELAMLIVTHCRSIPIINKVLEIKPSVYTLTEGEQFVCSSCFGKVSADNLYM